MWWCVPVPVVSPQELLDALREMTVCDAAGCVEPRTDLVLTGDTPVAAETAAALALLGLWITLFAATRPSSAPSTPSSSSSLQQSAK